MQGSWRKEKEGNQAPSMTLLTTQVLKSHWKHFIAGINGYIRKGITTTPILV